MGWPRGGTAGPYVAALLWMTRGSVGERGSEVGWPRGGEQQVLTSLRSSGGQGGAWENGAVRWADCGAVNSRSLRRCAPLDDKGERWRGGLEFGLAAGWGTSRKRSGGLEIIHFLLSSRGRREPDVGTCCSSTAGEEKPIVGQCPSCTGEPKTREKSSHVGLVSSMSATLWARLIFLICFSRRIAFRTY